MKLNTLVSLLFYFLLLSSLTAHASDLMPIPALNINANEHAVEKMPKAGEDARTSVQDPGYPWRGLLIGGDHGSDDIHHDNIYVSINGGPVIYQTTIPARQTESQLTDPGLLWHLYTRNNTEITVYASSSLENGLESELSEPFPLFFSYPVPFTCTEQTVPLSYAGSDQLVTVGAWVTLDASMSMDAYPPDNEGLAYRWECYSAPESSVILSDDGQNAVISFTPNQAGNYYFRLTVRDMQDGEMFNRSPISYVRVSAVQDLNAFINANAGRTQQARAGQIVTLDGSQSQSSTPITQYRWTMENPLGPGDIQRLANLLGTTGCQAGCYLSNYDSDADVDGMDIALLAANYSGIVLPDQAVVQFVAGISRPHIFRLTVANGVQTDSETTIVSVHHENANPVLTHPPVDPACLE